MTKGSSSIRQMLLHFGIAFPHHRSSAHDSCCSPPLRLFVSTLSCPWPWPLPILPSLLTEVRNPASTYWPVKTSRYSESPFWPTNSQINWIPADFLYKRFKNSDLFFSKQALLRAFSTLAFLAQKVMLGYCPIWTSTFWAVSFLVVGATLCMARCFTASLAYTGHIHCSPKYHNQKCLQTLVCVPWGQNCSLCPAV